MTWNGHVESKFEKKKKNAKKDLQKTKTKQQKILLYEQTKNEFTHYGQNKSSYLYSKFYSFSLRNEDLY